MRFTAREVFLDGDELARAIDLYLVARGVYVGGPRTVSISVDGADHRLLEGVEGRVYVDPSGRLLADSCFPRACEAGLGTPESNSPCGSPSSSKLLLAEAREDDETEDAIYVCESCAVVLRLRTRAFPPGALRSVER